MENEEALEVYARPRVLRLQQRRQQGQIWEDVQDYPMDARETLQNRVDRSNAAARFRKFRIVTR